MIRFTPPTDGEVVELGDTMRLADREELAACGEYDAHAVVRRCVAGAALAWSVSDDNGLLCIVGVSPLRPVLLLEHVGTPWMLGTTRLFAPGSESAHRRSLAVDSRAYIALMLDRFPSLVNFVHAENKRATRWLASLGFTLSPAAPYGPHGAPFHRFEKHV